MFRGLKRARMGEGREGDAQETFDCFSFMIGGSGGSKRREVLDSERNVYILRHFYATPTTSHKKITIAASYIEEIEIRNCMKLYALVTIRKVTVFFYSFIFCYYNCYLNLL